MIILNGEIMLNETQRITNTEWSSRFFTEIHVYQLLIFLFPRLLFPSLCSFINLKCISKLNNYYELFHRVSYKKYKPVKVFFSLNQFFACKSFSTFLVNKRPHKL